MERKGFGPKEEDMQKHGTVIYWDARKGFGFVATRTDNLLEKFFLHVSRISLSELDSAEIQPGHFVRFDVSTVPPKKDGYLRFAVNAEVYKKDPNLLIEANAASPLAGTETSTSAVSR